MFAAAFIVENNQYLPLMNIGEMKTFFLLRLNRINFSRENTGVHVFNQTITARKKYES